MRRQLDYLCMQPTRQGQASYAHVNEIVAGLRRRGWDVRLVEPPHPRPGRADGLRRALFAASTQLSYWVECRFRPARFAVALDSPVDPEARTYAESVPKSAPQVHGLRDRCHGPRGASRWSRIARSPS